jgi:hypothetical protein
MSEGKQTRTIPSSNQVIGMTQQYVVELTPDLTKQIYQIDMAAATSLIGSDYKAAERLFKKQYEMIRQSEEKLAKGKRHHKGAPLHNLGISILLQGDPSRIQEGYKNIILAFIEDLLDYDNIEGVHAAPAYQALLKNPSINRSLLELIEQKVEQCRSSKQIPRDPEEVFRLKLIEEKTKEATIKPIEITIDQVRKDIDDWLEKKGKIEKRVFVGGNYKNIALLRHIEKIVQDFDFVPIMPIEMPETSAPSHEKLIHDMSIEMLQRCSYAIFEVTISNGHLMEIERARDFKHLKTMLAFQAVKQEDRLTVTKMLMSKDFGKVAYRNLSELATAIRAFLPTT